jgi:hypothetical protein
MSRFQVYETCDFCAALVWKSDAQRHRDWHYRLDDLLRLTDQEEE